jgi:hypothetical protein
MLHVEKLGDAMQQVLGKHETQKAQETSRYQSVAVDLVRIMAWQGKADARIGEPFIILGREFAGLWEALSYVVHHQAVAGTEEVRVLKERVKMLEAHGEQVRSFSAWEMNVKQAFGNVST